MSLSTDLQIISMDKEQPIISKKVRYYDDSNLEARIVAPVGLG
jgi:type IV secretory pathway TraG/TraD family ATPase VirD4